MKYLLTLLVATFCLTSSFADHGFPSVSVKTLEGKAVNIQDYVGKGKVTVISFWATWCTPCKKELDALTELYPEWKENHDVEFLAITIDNARALSKVPSMVSSKGWEYTVLSDANQDLQRALNFQTIPQTFVLDGKGHIIYSHNGYSSGDEYELEEKVLEAVKK